MKEFTAMLFATTVAHALQKRTLVYASALLFLTGASVAWHLSAKTDDDMYLFWLDQIAIWSVSILSLYYALQTTGLSRVAFMTVCLILLCTTHILFTKWSCNEEATEYHSAIHVLITAGIHCILYGI
jgi:hypothetical protein